MAKNQPYLKHVHAHCPGGLVKRFPVNCSFRAIEVGPPPSAGHKFKFHGPYPVAGSLSALGVDPVTRTYEYALNYQPVH